MNRTVVHLAVAVSFLFVAMLFAAPLQAAESMKIAVLNVEKVLMTCSAGIAAKSKIEKRMKELKEELEDGKKELLALQDEMKKKTSAWNEEKKQEKGMEYQKKRRDLSVRQEDANMEMKNLQDRYLKPIMEKLEPIVKDLGKSKGFSVILPTNAVIYFDDAVDLTDEVTASLNAKMK